MTISPEEEELGKITFFGFFQFIFNNLLAYVTLFYWGYWVFLSFNGK